MGKKWNWEHENLFFLTRTPVVEITTVGGGYDDVDFYHDGCLYLFADQCVHGTPVPDRWWRNFIDQQFLKLCSKLYTFFICVTPKKTFKSLTTRKEGDKYIVRVQYDDVDLELEVEEMFRHFEQMVNNDL